MEAVQSSQHHHHFPLSVQWCGVRQHGSAPHARGNISSQHQCLGQSLLLDGNQVPNMWPDLSGYPVPARQTGSGAARAGVNTWHVYTLDFPSHRQEGSIENSRTSCTLLALPLLHPSSVTVSWVVESLCELLKVSNRSWPRGSSNVREMVHGAYPRVYLQIKGRAPSIVNPLERCMHAER